MRTLKFLTTVGVALAFCAGATMACAQSRPATPTAAEAAGAALAQTLIVELRRMTDDMDAAYRGARGDADKARRDMDAVVARYQPTFDAQAVWYQEALAPDIDAATTDVERERLIAASTQAGDVIRGLPSRMPEIVIDSHTRVNRANREAAVAGALAGLFMMR